MSADTEYWYDVFWRLHDDDLRQHANSGDRQEHIAEKLGITTKQLRLRISKLGVKWTRGRPKIAGSKPRQRKPKSTPTLTPTPEPEPELKPTPTLKPKPKRKRESVIETQEPKRVWDFPGSRKCVFPFGDPGGEGFRFCTADVVEGRSYCLSHLRLCYTNTLKKRAEVVDVAAD